VWIGSSNYGPHTATFVPPHHARVSDAVDDLVAFMKRDDLAVLAQAALAHAQFETIHPFVDGNGRTGRALVHCVLRAKGLMRRVIHESWSDQIHSRRQAAVWRALDVVPRQPVLDNSLLRRELDVSVMGADAAIAELERIGALLEITGGRRNRRYAAPAVLDALDAFAKRAEKRTA
jgi:Fic family protein